MRAFNDPTPRFIRSPELPPGRLARWKESVRAAPDLRWEKVQRVREAIQLDAYESDQVIERFLDRFENEIGILCRREE